MIPIPRHVIVLLLVLPLAVILGYKLATPDDLGAVLGVGLVFGVLSLPLLLKWHYPMLVFSWNAVIAFAFLPGSPSLWMCMTIASLFFSVLANLMNRQLRLQNVRLLNYAMIFMAGSVLFTVMNTGVGMRALGSSDYGGKKYVMIILALLGYFALSVQRIPKQKVRLYCGLFLLSGLTLAMGNLVYMAGDAMYWMYYFFPVDFVVNQATEDFLGMASTVKFTRLSGVAWAGLATYGYMLARYGMRGCVDFTRPWRAVVVVGSFAIGLLGGFRSIVVIYLLLGVIQLFFEKSLSLRTLPWQLGLMGLIYALLVSTAGLLPLSVQRSLSVVPFLQLDPAARADAEASTQWRLRLWEVLMPEIPKYFLVGKGYTTSATDHHLALESWRRGLSEDTEMSLIAGDYHNGPLSILIPFGIWGLIAFVFFMVAALRVLYHYYKHGDPELWTLNTFFLSYFVARLVFFLFVVGSVTSDMWVFCGLVGFSVALNGESVATQPQRVRQPEAAAARPVAA